MLTLLISCTVIMLASLSGKLIVWGGAGAFVERNLHFMVSFAGGVFLVFAWQVGTEVFEHMALFSGLAWIAVGALAINLICKWLPHSHVAPDGAHDHDRPHLDPHRMLISDSAHNAGDGILLAASYSINPAVGFAATTSVLVHEVVQEIAEFFVLRDAGYPVRRALLLNFATSATILIGAIGGYVLLELFEAFEAPLLAIATGGVLSVVFYDLIPHSVKDARSRSQFQHHILWFALGCILMYGMTHIVPHQDPAHEEGSAVEQMLSIS